MHGAASHRTRFGVGLGLALALGVGLGALATRAGREAVAESRDRRQAVASLLQLVDLVDRAGAEGDDVRRAVAAWQAETPQPSTARVVLLSGIRLEASTAPGDAGERAAPRRLAREEKELFDRAKRLDTALRGNASGAALAPEVELEPTVAGYRAAAPLERDGRLVGMVQVEVPTPPPVEARALAPLLAFALPLVLFALLARALPGRRLPLAAAALALLALAMIGAGAWAERTLAAEHARAHQAVADHTAALAARTAAIVGALGLPADPAPRPDAWDVDVYRRPLGLLGAEGAVAPGRAAEVAAAARQELRVVLAVVGVLAAIVLVVVGLGVLNQVGAALSGNRSAYLYIAPAMAGMLLLVFFPFFYGIALSFTSSNLYNTSQPLTELWAGFKNYSAILGDVQLVRHAEDGSRVVNYQNFYWTLFFTIAWTVTNVAIGVTLGLVLALMLNVKGLALRPIYRVLLILPWAMPNYITALIWKGMFHQQYGVVNQFLGIFGVDPIMWTESPFTSYLTALATNGWLSFPFMMVVSLGALQSIPADIYEAARVDGATRWQQFTSITLPSLKPALVPAIILSVVWTFNMFNIIYLVTAGEPGGATEILVTQAYKLAFEKYQYGYAAAYSTIIFMLLLVYGVFQNRVTRATEGI